MLIMKMDNEEHAKLPRSLGKILFGMEDGLVTALGTVLGVSAATNDPRIVLIAGIVATFAESVSMFFGSYLSAQAKKELYERAYKEEEREFHEEPKKEREELMIFYGKMGFGKKDAKNLTEKTMKDKKLFMNVMMREEFGMMPDHRGSPFKSALIYWIATLIGMIAIVPFAIMAVGQANIVSVALVMLTLFTAGALKTRYTKRSWIRSGLEMMAIGMFAAAVGYVAGLRLGTVVL